MLDVIFYSLPFVGAAVAEWLSSWLAEQGDRGSIPGLATWIFRDWLSPASKSRYGWKIAKSTLILKTTNQPTLPFVKLNIVNIFSGRCPMYWSDSRRDGRISEFWHREVHLAFRLRVRLWRVQHPDRGEQFSRNPVNKREVSIYERTHGKTSLYMEKLHIFRLAQNFVSDTWKFPVSKILPHKIKIQQCEQLYSILQKHCKIGMFANII